MVFQKRKYTLKLHLSFCYISYVLKMISFRLKEEKRSLDADWSRASPRFLPFFTAPHRTWTVFFMKYLKIFKILVKYFLCSRQKPNVS